MARGAIEGGTAGGATHDLEVTITLTAPRRWDIDHPTLYTVRTVIRADGRVRDVYDTPFGSRTMRFSADHGFWLNERRVPSRVRVEVTAEGLGRHRVDIHIQSNGEAP